MFAVFIILSFPNCSNDDDGTTEESCINPPCGSIEANASNITILRDLAEEISIVTFIVDGEEIDIDVTSLDRVNEFSYGCWQTIPSSNVTAVAFTIEDEDFELTLDGNVNSDQLVIVISQATGTTTARLEDYVACNDNPTN